MTITKSNDRIILTASKGKYITDGADICGKKVILAIDRDQNEFYETDQMAEVHDGIPE